MNQFSKEEVENRLVTIRSERAYLSSFGITIKTFNTIKILYRLHIRLKNNLKGLWKLDKLQLAPRLL